ncbi:hypothetical protein Patl1_04324 [Pistacia atlantica]|uniref:Uncharacterized protein n=1 Tax=Pistacia atlantica TaxID=434234 RepID=A0ACC1BTC3_9ROSI|nr:hypothetical protein Patl1_04324 [Pistacia atlantica]
MLIYKAPLEGKIETLNSIPDVYYSHTTHRGNNVIHLAAELGHKTFVLEARCSGYPYLKSEKNLKESIGILLGLKDRLKLINQPENYGNTALHSAAAAREKKINRIVAEQMQEGTSFAMLNNTELNVKAFLSLPQIRELVNESDNEGNTPLHLAPMNHKHKLVKKLIPTKCVDLRAKNQNEKTALGISFTLPGGYHADGEIHEKHNKDEHQNLLGTSILIGKVSLKVFTWRFTLRVFAHSVVFLLILASGDHPDFLHKAIIYKEEPVEISPAWRDVGHLHHWIGHSYITKEPMGNNE